MLQKHQNNKIIFLNIETVPQKASYKDLSEKEEYLFTKKFGKEIALMWPTTPKGIPPEDAERIYEHVYQNNAALTPEFGKIACISFLVLVNDSEYHAMSICDPDEKVLLKTFLDKVPSIRDWPKVDTDKKKSVCSYSGFGFTWPFIAHRFLLNYLPIPPMFDYSEGKPWKQEHLISLMNIWNYNRSSSYTSLATLANSFGVEFNDQGDAVSDWFYNKREDVIKEYSLQKTVTLATVYLRIKGITNNLTKAK